VAEQVTAFGSTVIGSDPNPDTQRAHMHDVEIVAMPELFKCADIISNHASNMNDHRLFSGELAFLSMKPGSWLVHMARGDMIDDMALNRAIDSGRLSGAGLDVYLDEPYTGVLCDNERVILSPHQATLAIETRNGMETGAVENLVRYLKGSDSIS